MEDTGTLNDQSFIISKREEPRNADNLPQPETNQPPTAISLPKEKEKSQSPRLNRFFKIARNSESEIIPDKHYNSPGKLDAEQINMIDKRTK